MQKRRLTIARLLGVILFCGIILAGLRSGSTDWFKSIYSLTFLILVYAGIAARYRRAFWYGFAVAGWAYFVMGFGPWVGSSFPTGAHASMVWTGTRPPGEVNTELLSSLALDFVSGLMAKQDSAVLQQFAYGSTTGRGIGVAGVRLRTPVHRPEDRGPKTDPSHPDVCNPKVNCCRERVTHRPKFGPDALGESRGDRPLCLDDSIRSRRGLGGEAARERSETLTGF